MLGCSEPASNMHSDDLERCVSGVTVFHALQCPCAHHQDPICTSLIKPSKPYILNPKCNNPIPGPRFGNAYVTKKSDAEQEKVMC